MVNPRMNKKNTVEFGRGIPRHLLCAPFALALTAAIPMGVAYADEVVPAVDQESSSAAVEVAQDSQADTFDLVESTQESDAEDSSNSLEGESGSVGLDAPVNGDDKLAPGTLEAEDTSSAAAPDTSSAADSDSDSSDSADSAESEAPNDADAVAVITEEAAQVATPVAAATGQTEVAVTGTYKQTEARKMLELVNADREKTNKSQELSWDYALEQYAMQRAAEIYYSFSHTRPNGAAFSDEIMRYGYYSVGENIHMATGTNNHGASKANQAWIDSTGHHINRTKTKWQGYAAACFYLPKGTFYRNGVAVTGGVWCWVELFSTPNGNPNYSAPVDDERTVTVVLVGDNYKAIEGAVDNGSNAYSKGWWYDEKKDKFTYIREVTYTSYVPMYIGTTGRVGNKYYDFDTEGFLKKECEKDLPFTREEFLGLVPTTPGQDPTKPPQGTSQPLEPNDPNQGSNGTNNGTNNNPNNGSNSNPNLRPVINTKDSRSEESQTRVTPGAIADEYGYTLYVTPDITRSGARWETTGNRTVFRLADGSLATGWVVDGGQRFYLDPNGEMAKGWRRINGAWYFFDSSDGTMKTGVFEVNGDRYFANTKGAMQTGWIEINGERYFAEASGIIRPREA